MVQIGESKLVDRGLRSKLGSKLWSKLGGPNWSIMVRGPNWGQNRGPNWGGPNWTIMVWGPNLGSKLLQIGGPNYYVFSHYVTV